MEIALNSYLTAPVLEHSVYLEEKVWQQQQSKLNQTLEPIVAKHRQRRLIGEKHPIIDFLFDYYHFKPSKLLEWTPGIGVYLLSNQAQKFLKQKAFCKSGNDVFVDPQSFPVDRIAGLDWTINLLEQTLGRKPLFNCFGLHEWCMVYEQDDIRHGALPLRLNHEQTRNVVEQHSVQCTHYDAYRFYSKTAVEFNKVKLSRDNMPANEQPGCLHTNMDLYRWTYKFHPWISSELISKTFLLALEIRETDMRASPYDVDNFSDLPAIKIETADGKTEYIKLQKEYFERSQPIRLELIQKLRELRACCR